jgi:hypothetical protein
LSIGTAAIFWFFNALNKDYDTTIGHPVNWQFDSEAYIVIDELPESIRINVNGLGWNLLRASLGFKVKPVTIILSNPALNKKIAGISLTNRVNDELEDLQLNYILDDTLSINIDKRGSRSFGVYVDTANISLAENYRIVSPINHDVHLLELEGPLSLINAHPSDSFIVTIDDQRINNNFDEQLDFEIDRPELFLFRPKSTNISFTVAEFVQAERQIIIEQIDFPQEGASLIDTICTVRFTVRKDLEATIVADSFQVSANFVEINKLDSTLILRIKKFPPEAIELLIALPQVLLNYDE